MINWKVRMRNPMFWAQILLSVIMPILAYLGLTAEDLSLVVGIGGSTYKGGFKPVHFEPCNCQCI